MVMRAGNRAGKIRLGCLVTLVLLAAGVFVGLRAGKVYFRYYRLQDFVNGQVDFAPVLTDDVIRDRLVDYCDSLGIGLGPRDWTVRRSYSPREIVVEARYRDSIVIALGSFRKVVYVEFKPAARSAF